MIETDIPTTIPTNIPMLDEACFYYYSSRPTTETDEEVIGNPPTDPEFNTEERVEDP